MDHIIYWPKSLNFPYDKDRSFGFADEFFWRELVGCYSCQSEFNKLYSEEYPETKTRDFWDEVDFYLDGYHLKIERIAEYFRAEVLVVSGVCDEQQTKNLEKEFTITYCHFLICRRCSMMYDNIEERVGQENSKVDEVLKYHKA